MGLQVLMTLNYYNYELGPGMLTGAKTKEVRGRWARGCCQQAVH
jgi:hypothetical protein